MSHRYAISGIASRPAPRRNRIHAEIGQAVDILESGSPEEAEREGLRRLKGLYPERDGWEDHSVVVMVIEATEAFPSREGGTMNTKSDQPSMTTDKGHVLLTRQTCPCKGQNDRCPVCEWGLAVCALCGAAEIELDRRCRPRKASQPGDIS
jgi:hypothetical protein